MLRAMRRRTPFVRFLALFWAALQLASPRISSIADGRMAAQNASGPTTHVESTTTSSCPVVHSPDCAVCRYLSGSACAQQLSALGFPLSVGGRGPRAESREQHRPALTLPHGRAPPTI